MFRNYLKIMLRSLLKRKAFTLINLLGLATGMAVCLLLVLYISNELGYDNFHQHGDQIYRLGLERKYPDRSAFRGGIPQSIGQVVKKEFPEVLESTRVMIFDYNGAKVSAGEKSFTEKNVLLADPNFFRVFTGSFLQGDAITALEKPGTAIINESTAKRYFGSAENSIGKQLVIGEFRKCIITGVCRDWPEKSHFDFTVLMSTSGMEDLNRAEYIYFGPYTYLLLNKQVSVAALEKKLPLIVEKYTAGTVEKVFGETYDKFVAEGNGYHYFLQPLEKIHLHSELEDELKPTSSMRTLILLAAIAGFILFLACINFINLSTAVSVERAREVGIRKTFGSQKAQLRWQFLSESIFFSLISMLLAFVIVVLFIPLLNKISDNNLRFSYFLQPAPLLLILAFSVLTGICAGLYPAFVLSSFDPIEVLKGRFKSNRKGILLRNGLVVFQFMISVILIVSTIVVNQQMQLMLGDRLGFKQDHIIAVDGIWRMRTPTTPTMPQAFVDEISGIPGVEEITKCDQLPGNDDSGGGSTWVALDNNASRTQRLAQVDDNYFKLLGLELKEGRFFSRAYTTDSMAIVLNERAVQDFGLKNPIGARLVSKEAWMNSGTGQDVFTVVGVVKDFHFQSLRKKIAPLVFVNSNRFGWGTAGVRIKSDHFSTTIAAIEQTWHRLDPKHDLNLSFFDQRLAAQYKAEKAEKKIFTVFSLLAIIIACVGLFGLAAYSAVQRRKEISIRKVLGAMPANIIFILLKDFLILVGIASLIAFPLAWWAMYEWLQHFAYRVTVSWLVFLEAGSIAIGIALLTTSYHAIRSVLANPMKNLKAD